MNKTIQEITTKNWCNIRASHKFIHFSKGVRIEKSELIICDRQAVKRISRVLRYAPGDEFIAVTNNGSFHTRIKNISRDQVICVICGMITGAPEPVDVSFVLAPVKNFRLYEETVKYLSQIGISAIYFLNTDRCQYDISDKKISRLQSIAGKHAEISKHAFCPEINRIAISELKGWERQFVLHTGQSEKLFKSSLEEACESSMKGSSVFISGPEGGFSEKDIDEFSHCPGLRVVRLEGTVFKAETVPIYIGSILHYLHSRNPKKN